MSSASDDSIQTNTAIHDGAVGPLTHAQLKEHLSILVQGCNQIEAHINAGTLAIPTKDFAAIQNALQALKKANTPPRDKRNKLDTQTAPTVKLGSFIKKHLKHK